MVRVKPPARFGGDRLQPASHSPAHGEHTFEVLQSLGRTDQEIANLIEQGIVQQPKD
jgi:crotonobetainyl-CoA:carnitine CoA-transferase CaiB-like acyl-CoA transferase